MLPCSVTFDKYVYPVHYENIIGQTYVSTQDMCHRITLSVLTIVLTSVYNKTFSYRCCHCANPVMVRYNAGDYQHVLPFTTDLNQFSVILLYSSLV